MNSPAEIAKNYLDIGSRKTYLPTSKMFVLAVFAGLFIAMGGYASSVASYGVTPAAVGRYLSASIFPVGLMMVLVAGGELFTGNSLIIIPLLQKRNTIGGMMRNWGIVYLGNLLGSLLLAWLVVVSIGGSLYNGGLMEAMVSTAKAKVSMNFGDAFLRGVLCNFMVCIAVWVSFSATELAGKILALYLPILLFVLAGFEHCVANMYFIPVGILAAHIRHIPAEGLNWLTFVVKNLLPVTLGNIGGGMVMVGMGYWYVYIQGKED